MRCGKFPDPRKSQHRVTDLVPLEPWDGFAERIRKLDERFHSKPSTAVAAERPSSPSNGHSMSTAN
eukprot:11714495-Karenia_brevis.AAC.1